MNHKHLKVDDQRISRNLIILNYNRLQIKFAMTSEDKVTEIFYIANDCYWFFDSIMKKYTEYYISVALK